MTEQNIGGPGPEKKNAGSALEREITKWLDQCSDSADLMVEVDFVREYQAVLTDGDEDLKSQAFREIVQRIVLMVRGGADTDALSFLSDAELAFASDAGIPIGVQAQIYREEQQALDRSIKEEAEQRYQLVLKRSSEG